MALALGLNLAPDAAPAAACTIAVLGDSLTAGYGVRAEAAFPAVLEAELGRRGFACRVQDAGVSGDTSAGGRARLAWVLADGPSHLLVELGGNDGLRALPPEQLLDNLDAITATALARGVPVMLAGMEAPPNLGPDYTGAFRAAFRVTAERHGVPLYPFFLDGVVQVQGLMQPDGIHPSEAGVAEIVRRIAPAVAAWLAATGVPARPG